MSLDYRNIFSPIGKEVKRIIQGNSDYPSKSKKVLDKFKDARIKTAVVMRNPVSKAINEFIRFNTDQPFDKLFHLAIVLDTDKGQLLLEKNEVLNLSTIVPVREGAEFIPVEINKDITIQQLLDNTRNYLGDNFFKYSAYGNNCQDFIIAVLKSNDLGDSSVFEFVKQNTEDIFRTNPTLRKLVNTVTDIAGRFTGAGKARRTTVTQESLKKGGLLVKANPFNDWGK